MPQEGPSPREFKEEDLPTYEKALDAVRILKAAGVENPLDETDERIDSAKEAVAAWAQSLNLHMRGVGNPEKAANLVRLGRIYVDAGYQGPKFLKSALEFLNDEHADAMREDGDEQSVRLFREAIDAIESQLTVQKPKEGAPAIVQAKIEEARALAEQGKETDAIGILTLALIDPRFKRLPKEILAHVRELRDTIKTRSQK